MQWKMLAVLDQRPRHFSILPECAGVQHLKGTNRHLRKTMEAKLTIKVKPGSNIGGINAHFRIAQKSQHHQNSGGRKTVSSQQDRSVHSGPRGNGGSVGGALWSDASPVGSNRSELKHACFKHK